MEFNRVIGPSRAFSLLTRGQNQNPDQGADRSVAAGDSRQRPLEDEANANDARSVRWEKMEFNPLISPPALATSSEIDPDFAGYAV